MAGLSRVGLGPETSTFGTVADDGTATANPIGDDGVQFAINTAPFHHSEDLGETAFGSHTQIGGDLLELGLSIARHPGRLQIFYDEIFGEDPATRPPVPAGACEASSAIDSAGVLANRMGHLEELVRHIDSLDQPFRLIITLVTLGINIPDDAVEFDVPTDRGLPLGLRWSTDHIGETVTIGTTVYEFASGGSELLSWDLNTLDPGNPYKRHFLSLITQQISSVIAEVRARPAVDGIVLEDYIEGFEIGNEIESKSIVEKGSHGYPDGRGDWDGWGRLDTDVAVVMLGHCPWARLYQPGLQSFDDSGPEYTTWYGKITFLDNMLDSAQLELGELGSAWTLADIVTGIDLHYYHGTSSKVRSLAHLYADIAELRG